MRTTAQSSLIAVLVLAAGCALPVIEVARGQPGAGGGGQPAPSGRFVATMGTGGLVQVEDTSTGARVIAPNGLAVAVAGRLSTSLEFLPADGGYDVVVRYANNTGVAQDLGTINVAGMRLGERVEVGDFRHDAKFLEFDSQGGRFTTAGRDYPSDLYSPVGVIRDERYTIGMSLSYPILDYEHGVRINYHVPGGSFTASGFSWNGEFLLQGQMEPGESREYRLSVRVVENERNWLETLVPYRDYFQELYGAVRYERDPRPVLGFFAGMNAAITASNPYGFDSPTRRPDQHGWGPWADYIASNADGRGYERVMVWAPSGMFRQHQEMNYPFQFMTGMDRNPLVRDTAGMLDQRTEARGIDLGFWWGRSSMVMREWDTEDWEPLDPDKPEHVQRAMAELDLAVARGAELIGLDAFVYADQWDGFRWIEMMRARHPQVKFVIEPSACDFQHVVAATWVEGLHHVQTPPILQDFLVPGHETWASTRMDLYRQFRGITPDDSVKNSYWRELAEQGYVVQSFEVNTRLSGDWSAHEGWLRNIPAELRSDPRSWTSPGGGSPPSPDPVPGGGPGGPDPEPPSGGGGPDPEPPSGGGGSGGGAGAGSGSSGGGAGAGGGLPQPPAPGGSGGSGAGGGQPPPRVSTSPITPQSARSALNRPQPGAGSSAGGSVRQRIEARREARRLASLSDAQWEKRKVRRARLIERLGLGSMTYRDRVAALRSYRQERAAERSAQRASAVATHPDGE